MEPRRGPAGPFRHTLFVNSIYFSLTTYSSLGYGDVIPTGAIKLLAGTEALAGLLLIGWTAAYLYMTMERFWQLPTDKGTS